MENKCNKTPNSNNKYLDHVYCHTSESKNYIRANNINNNNINAGLLVGNNEMSPAEKAAALLKENKQLKTMLILHLDLIQEQSEQLLSKDKQLNARGEELDTLRLRNTQLEAQVQELQKQLQRQIKRAAVAAGEITSLPPPPLAKIQCKTEPITQLITTTAATSHSKNKTTNIIGECNGKLISKIILHRVNMSGGQSPHSSTASESCASDADEEKAQHDDNDDEEIDQEMDEQEVEHDLGTEETCNSTEESSNDDTPTSVHSKRSKRSVTSLSLTMPRGAKPRRPLVVAAKPCIIEKAPVQVCVTPPTPSRGKQMPLMLWHAPDMHTDESASCDSIADVEQTTTSPALLRSCSDTKKTQPTNVPPVHPSHAHQHHHAKSRRCAYISTPQMYCTREWEDEEFHCEYEFIKEEANELHADAPMLEIPKWTEHDITVSYCIEGTEDLSDETFLKRHTKLEVDEKRRKKWDVQQIREQRRIEKLKRRHCKDEIQTASDQQPLLSFYPQPDAIETICFVNDVPVQAFGEMIPKLSTNSDFALPWLESSLAAASSTSTTSAVASAAAVVATFASISNASGSSSSQVQQQMLNSSFVFLKKRKRQQSSSTGATTARQRSAAAAKVATQQSLAASLPAVVTPALVVTGSTPVAEISK